MLVSGWHLLGPDVLCGCERQQTSPIHDEAGLTACEVDFSLSLSLAVKSKNACPSTEGLVFFLGYWLSIGGIAYPIRVYRLIESGYAIHLEQREIRQCAGSI